MDHDDVEQFLTRYGDALGRFDSAASAALWGTPGMIVDDHAAGVLDDREAMAQGLEQSYPLYRALGLASVDHETLRVESLTDAVALVHVRWIFLDAAGATLTDSTAYYVLRRSDDGLVASVCIQVDDAARLQELAERQGVDLAAFMP